MKTDYAGIDYGLGKINTDGNFRYGVIPANEVGQAWYDESEGEYGKPFCPDCFNEVDETADFSFEGGPMQDNEGNEIIDEYFCVHCEKGVDENNPEIWPENPICFYYAGDGYEAHQSQDDCDIFITKSPYFTYAQFCSPCAPGAVYLMNPLDIKEQIREYVVDGISHENNRGYCFGHDWFESGKAPYPVYSVKTGKLVND
jgi:hypothetical protein